MSNGKNKSYSATVPNAYLESYFSYGLSGQSKITQLDSSCRIHLHSRRKRLTDADGISGKAAIDGLVYARLLVDDSPEFVEGVSYSQEKIKTGEMEETIIEVWG